MACKN